MFEKINEMYQRNSVLATFAVAVTFAAAAFGALNLAEAAHQVRQFFVGSNYMYSTSISVQGKATRDITPDVARMTFTVSEEGKTQGESSDAVSAKVESIVTYLKGQGVKEEDIDTKSLNSYQTWQQMPPCEMWPCAEPMPKGFETSQMVEVKMAIDGDDALDFEKIYGGVAALQPDYVSFPEKGIDDIDAVREELELEAIADARSKADDKADALGLSIVRVSGYYQDAGGCYGGCGYDAMYSESAGGAPMAKNAFIPIGEQELEVTVNVSFDVR